jgi:hypothetical protein
MGAPSLGFHRDAWGHDPSGRHSLLLQQWIVVSKGAVAWMEMSSGLAGLARLSGGLSWVRHRLLRGSMTRIRGGF